MKGLTSLFIFLFVSSFSYGQNWDRKLLIDNKVVQINEYYNSLDSIKLLSAAYFYNDSGLLIQSDYYLQKTGSGNSIYLQKFFSYTNNQISKDSTIWFEQVTVSLFVDKNKEGQNEVISIGRLTNGKIISRSISKEKNGKEYFSKITYYKKGVPYSTDKKIVRYNETMYRKRHIWRPRLNQTSTITTLYNTKDSLCTRYINKRYGGIKGNHKRIKTDQIKSTSYTYGTDGLLLKERTTIKDMKKETGSNGHSYTWYEYIKK